MPKNDRTLRHSPIRNPTTREENFTAEGDSIETALSAWLVRTRKRLMRRRLTRKTNHPRWAAEEPVLDQEIPLFRALVTVWLTSPQVRARYSRECREGLLYALVSMDDRTTKYLIDVWVQEEREEPPAAMAVA